MIIYPAIDIRGGRCVRLTEGRFDAETVLPMTRRRWLPSGRTAVPNGCILLILTVRWRAREKPACD